MVNWPATSRRHHGPPTMGLSRMAYSPFRTPSSAALVTAAIPADVPPEATRPITANCDPPENMKRLSTHVCHRSSPAVTESAPNDTPYAATASPTAKLDLIAARSSLLLATAEGRSVCGARRGAGGETDRLQQHLGSHVLVEQ